MPAPPRTPKPHQLVVVALLVLHAALALASVRYKSPTIDEGGHYDYGRRWLEGDTGFDKSSPYGYGKTPFSAANAVPWALAEGLEIEPALIRLATSNGSPAPSSSSVPPEQVFPVLTGRLATIPFSVLLAWVVFRWSRELHGLEGGLLSLLLCALCPNLLAFSHLIMTDLYAALMVTAASYLFWRYLRRGGWWRGAASALALGVAQLAKYSCIFLYPLFAAVALVSAWPAWRESVRSRDPRRVGRLTLRAAAAVGLFVAAGLGVLNAGYLGNGSFAPLGEYAFQSELFQSLRELAQELGDPPVPLPAPPLEGLDALRYYERAGRAIPNIYLLGQLRIARPGLEGFPGYFLVASLFKLPLATQAFLLVALLSYLPRRARKGLGTAELALFAPIAFYVVYFNFFYKAQIGIRHYLPVLPLLFVFAGAAARSWKRRPGARAVAAGLALYLAVSVLSYYPHFLSYFNELVWDRKQAYRILADSNIDMLQNEWYLEDYLRSHPEVRTDSRFPGRAGRIAVNVNDVVGTVFPMDHRWLREGFEPVGHVAYSYLLYDIRPEDEARVPTPRTTLGDSVTMIVARAPFLGQRTVVHERGAGTLRPRRRWRPGREAALYLRGVDELAEVPRSELDLSDYEVFRGERLEGAQRDLYAARVARVPAEDVWTIDPVPFQRRGARQVVVAHPWHPAGPELRIEWRSDPEAGAARLTGSLPGVEPGTPLSLDLRLSGGQADGCTLRVGGVPVPLRDYGRDGEVLTMMTERFRAGSPGAPVSFACADPERLREPPVLTVWRWTATPPPG